MLIILRNIIISITLLFAAIITFISVFSWLIYGSGCKLEFLPSVSLLNGIIIDQEILECDVIAHYEVQSVYARILPSRKRQMLFRFDPGNPDFNPNVYAQADGSITIEIKEISSIIYQANLFGDKLVNYKIDHVDYPSKSAK